MGACTTKPRKPPANTTNIKLKHDAALKQNTMSSLVPKVIATKDVLSDYVWGKMLASRYFGRTHIVQRADNL